MQVVSCTSVLAIRILQYAARAKGRRLLPKDLVRDRHIWPEGGENMLDVGANVFDVILRG
jgi:hypothetical protein